MLTQTFPTGALRFAKLVPLVLIGTVLAAPPVRAVDEEAVKDAVERGVTHLKALQDGEGRWPHQEIGATALAALALLECGVPANDPALQKAAAAVRQASLALDSTYSLSLSILFLDRLGDADDVALIESMTVRLLGGQSKNGGWTYTCPRLSEAEVRRLTSLLRQRNELKATRELPKPAAGGARRTVADLPAEIQEQLKAIDRVRAAFTDLLDDNSNTQFAVLALWVAHRHGLPVDAALERIDARFRTSQHGNGGWGYTYVPGGVGNGFAMTIHPAMTCAGLLGLACAHGLAKEAKHGKPGRNPAADPAIRGGLLALGATLNPAFRMPGPPGLPDVPIGTTRLRKTCYFLWSMERVAVAYDLKTIGDRDWYAFGCKILLDNQEADGSWRGEYASCGADTSFALLFLKRANLASDLTAMLKGTVKDPGQAVLKAGGVGIEGLKALNNGTKPATESGAASTGPKPAAGTPREGPGASATDLDAQAARLSAELVAAAPAQQDKVLETLRQGKGVVYSQALAGAIPKLSGDAKKKAREALADRLTRMTSEVLGDKLQDEDLEIRRAAALACAMKEDKAHLPRLIEMLEDKEPPVARAAYAALKSLTGQDFGPAADATRAEQASAVAAWKAWLKKQGG